jgi:hypothetical protein
LATDDDFDTELDEDIDALDDEDDDAEVDAEVDDAVDDDVVVDDVDDEEDGEEEDEDGEDEEESLEVLLGRDDDDEDILRAVDSAGDRTKARVAIDEGEFTCRSCFLVKRKAQMADPKRLICLDCA